MRGKSVEVSNTIFRGHTPCYTNYSCTGLLGASQWSWPVWYSVVCCVCGAPLEVVSGAVSFPTTSLPPWEGLPINQATNDRTPSWLAIRSSPTLLPSRQSPICWRNRKMVESLCLREFGQCKDAPYGIVNSLRPARMLRYASTCDSIQMRRRKRHSKQRLSPPFPSPQILTRDLGTFKGQVNSSRV